MSAAS